MTSLENKLEAVQLVNEAVKNGARKSEAAKILNFSVRTIERWQKKATDDKRKGAIKSIPRKLTAEEEQQIIDTACSKRFKDKNPYQIVAELADEEVYIASESSFYRVLRKNGLLTHRSNTKPRQKRSKPDELKATGPNQVWSWDITYMKSAIQGIFFYLYLFIDVWSRKIVGYEIHDVENADIASAIMYSLEDKYDLKGVHLHSDRGGPMKGKTMLYTLYDLGIIPSFSRPRVSDDNPYSESLFKTLKYHASYPKSFKTIEEAREWVRGFVEWYNTEHKHSNIGYVTPEQRHTGEDIEILANRRRTYERARERNPQRWSRKNKTWDHISVIKLNPDNKKEVVRKVS